MSAAETSELQQDASPALVAVRSSAVVRHFMDIPAEIIEAALKVENWMKRNGHNRWELLGLCSRDHAAELKMWREGGITEEVLRRNDGYIKVGKGCAIVRADEVPNNDSASSH